MFLFYVNPILIAAAVIPAIVLLRFVYKEDRLDKESPGLLLSLVLFGIIATFAALVSEQIGEAVLALIVPENTTAYNAILYFVVVALSEEGFKYLLLKKRTWWSSEFNCQFDGIVYAVFVSLGFALWENISYVLMYGLGTAAVRAVTAVPGHACFGVFMGAFYGLAKRYDNFGDEWRSRRCRRFAVLVPVLLHGTYDFIATYEYDGYAWVFVGFVALLFLAAYRMIKTLSRDDRFINGSDYHYYNGPVFKQEYLRKLDHAMIYVLIAGSYTPICLKFMEGMHGILFVCGVWAVALCGILVKLCWMNAPRALYTGFYLLMGWAIVFDWKALELIPAGAIALLLAGGISYSIGAVFYILKKPNPSPTFGFHELFHVFILLGTFFHFLAVVFYVVL